MLINATCEKPLREIADHAPRPRLVFPGQKPDIVGDRQHVIEQAARILDAEQHVGVRESEAAGQERSLAGRKSILGSRAVVARHEAVDEQNAVQSLRWFP